MKVDVHSRGEIWAFLERWLAAGSIKPCQNIRLERTHAGYFKTVCTEDCASRVPAPNIDYVNWDGVRMTYMWPKCPSKCQRFMQSDDFASSAIRDQYEDQQQKRQQQAPKVFVEPLRLKEPMTWPWVKENLPLRYWVIGISALVTTAVTSFGVGFGAGHWAATYEHAAATANAPSTAPSAISVKPPVVAVKAATTKK